MEDDHTVEHAREPCLNEAHEGVPTEDMGLPSIGFMVALQCLHPTDRAALLLCDVIGFPHVEASEILKKSTTDIVTILERARASMQTVLDLEISEESIATRERDQNIVISFVKSFEEGNVPGVASLLSGDVVLTLLPSETEVRGPDSVAHFLNTSKFKDGERQTLLRFPNDRQLSFGRYVTDTARPGRLRAKGILVLRIQRSQIRALTYFANIEPFERYGLPQILDFPDFSTWKGDIHGDVR
jgi:RNA polymerase sigma-70 factor (ECF subfamily)